MNNQWMGTDAPVPDSQTLREEASESVLRDLVNALLHENVLGIADRGGATAELPEMHSLAPFELTEGECYFRLGLDTDRAVVFRVRRRRFIQSYTLSRLPVLLVTKRSEGISRQSLSPIEFMRVLAHCVSEEERAALFPNLSEFLAELGDAIEHTALSLEAAREYADGGEVFPPSSLLRIERLSSLRDRPFHPTSRAKRGWDSGDYRKFSPEFGRRFGLDWVAVRRDYVSKGSSEEDVGRFILNGTECRQLESAMASAGVNQGEYLALPVHPWQMRHVIPAVFKGELEKGICIPIIQGLGGFVATSSVRGLSPVHGGRYHVKVPIGIYSLAALRILPPRYLHNGEKGQELLQRIIDGEPLLRNRLHLCSEKLWWGFHDPEGDPYEDKPGHLACLVREYPAPLTEDKDVDLIAMSALAVMDRTGQVPAFSALLGSRYGSHAGQPEAAGLFREICQQFIETALICFRCGVMPEIHGQNVMLVVRDGHIAGLLLRDHDTIRLHLPWLEREGLANPNYTVKPGTPNSLINPSPEHLLSYFQTLGVQVNLYAIVDAVSQAYSLDEAELWHTVRATVRSCLTDIDWPEEVRDIMARQLLDSPVWPTRTLIKPLLQRSGSGGGGMPAGSGETDNPLRNL